MKKLSDVQLYYKHKGNLLKGELVWEGDSLEFKYEGGTIWGH